MRQHTGEQSNAWLSGACPSRAQPRHQKLLHEALPQEGGIKLQGSPPCPLLVATAGHEVEKPEVSHHQVQEQLFSCIYQDLEAAHTTIFLSRQWNTKDHLLHYEGIVFFLIVIYINVMSFVLHIHLFLSLSCIIRVIYA